MPSGGKLPDPSSRFSPLEISGKNDDLLDL
jgi:hypothetical protein